PTQNAASKSAGNQCHHHMNPAQAKNQHDADCRYHCIHFNSPRAALADKTRGTLPQARESVKRAAQAVAGPRLAGGSPTATVDYKSVECGPFRLTGSTRGNIQRVYFRVRAPLAARTRRAQVRPSARALVPSRDLS